MKITAVNKNIFFLVAAQFNPPFCCNAIMASLFTEKRENGAGG